MNLTKNLVHNLQWLYRLQSTQFIVTDGGVKSTSPVTESHNENGYVNNKNFIMTNEDINNDTKYTINETDMNKHDRARPAWVSTAARR